MSVKNNSLNYLSTWDIDQVLYQGEMDIIVLPGSTSTQTNVSLLAHNLNFPPVVDATFQVAGDTVWRQMGDSTSSGTVNLETFIASTSTNIYLVYYNFNVGSVTINVRYYVWTDKIIQ